MLGTVVASGYYNPHDGKVRVWQNGKLYIPNKNGVLVEVEPLKKRSELRDS